LCFFLTFALTFRGLRDAGPGDIEVGEVGDFPDVECGCCVDDSYTVVDGTDTTGAGEEGLVGAGGGEAVG